MDKLKPYIDVQKQKAVKPGEESVDKNKTHTCLTQEVDAKIGQEYSPLITSKSSSGQQFPGKDIRIIFVICTFRSLWGTSVMVPK